MMLGAKCPVKCPDFFILALSRLPGQTNVRKEKPKLDGVTAPPNLKVSLSSPPAEAPRVLLAARYWTDTRLLYTGRSYHDELLAAIRSARRSIRLETYIFELDPTGEALLVELEKRAAEGLKVRILIDAIGSPMWSGGRLERLMRHGVRARIFGRPRDLFRAGIGLFFQAKFARSLAVLRKIQLRNHRKLAIFDSEVAFVGSANIGGTFLEWRETTVVLRGPGVARLRASFARSWGFAAREKISQGSRRPPPAGIRNNFTRSERKAVNDRLVERIRASQRRVWITTAYFHPRPKVLLALFSALRRRIDVAILVPRRSDVTFFPWLSRAFFVGLIDAGARVYEYTGTMMHAKTTVFDDIALVGSTNLNYRSFMHDLELDVVLDTEECVQALDECFRKDLSQSELVTRDVARNYSFAARLVTWCLFPFKRWL